MPVAGNFGPLPGGGGIEPPPPRVAPPVDRTFAGPLQAQPGLSGDVVFGVSAAGTKVSDPIVHLVLDNHQCDGATISVDQIQKLVHHRFRGRLVAHRDRRRPVACSK